MPIGGEGGNWFREHLKWDEILTRVNLLTESQCGAREMDNVLDEVHE